MNIKRKELIARVETERYLLEAHARFFRKSGGFYVKAIDKSTLRNSFVTNMNGLMDEFASHEFDLDNPAIQETSWEGTIFQLRKWFNRARQILNDKNYQPYFQRLLDDDRLSGECENKLW